MRRVEFLKSRWMSSDKLAASARSDHSLPVDAKLFEMLVGIDPTPTKIYADFILRCYANREFLAEDGERFRETLVSFHANKRRLPVARRDIGSYASERDIWEVLSGAGLVSQPESGKQAKRSDRNRAHLESDVTHSEEWTMALIKTPFAATWWGIGTRWCTTEKSGRTFNHYAGMGNLRVFVSPAGVKHQLHIGTASLCDAADKPVRMDSYLRKLPEAFLDAIRGDIASAFASTNIEDEHTFLYRRTALLSLPASLFEAETLAVFERMKEAGLSKLRQVSAEEGWALRISASDLSSWAIRYALGEAYEAPRDRKGVLGMLETPEGVRLAVDFSAGPSSDVAELLERMPGVFRETVLAKFVKSWSGNIEAGGRQIDAVLRNLPPGQLSPTFWKAWAKKAVAVPRSGQYEEFGYIPGEAMSVEMAHVFAKSGARHRIPGDLLTDGVAIALAKYDIKYLDDPEVLNVMSKRQIAGVFGSNNGGALRDLPDEYRTADMIRLVVDECPAALGKAVALIVGGTVDMQGVDRDDLIQEITLNALSQRSASVSDATIPLAREVYLDTVSRCSSMLAWVPLEYRDVEMCERAVSGETSDGLCHFPVWVVNEIRAGLDGRHGITENYRPSQKYAHVLKELRKPDGPIAAKLPPFKSAAVEAPEYRRSRHLPFPE